MPSIRLHNQVCAYIDVLGGSQLFRGKDRRRAADFFALLAEFERRLNGYSSHFPKKRQAVALVKTFSDNIFVAFPLRSSSKANDHDVVHLFLSELETQVHQLTILAGFPLRGAVTVGPLMFTDRFLFGPALVDAVNLEKEAVFPRILLSKALLRYIKPESSSTRLVVQDSDGKSFLHYLGGLGLQLRPHLDFVQRGLLENLGKVRERQKYEWLAQYHNFAAACVDRPDLFVPITQSLEFKLGRV